uniref:Uncharacterized protein n=1 Tax=Caenorhabditis japonica TaxID=281687 RepID=A0A8R1E4V4_CAEJA
MQRSAMQLNLSIHRLEKRSAEDETVDEIKMYLDYRYICAPEVFHHIYRFPFQKNSDAIFRLFIHLFSYSGLPTWKREDRRSKFCKKRDYADRFLRKKSTLLISNELERTSKGSRTPENSPTSKCKSVSPSTKQEGSGQLGKEAEKGPSEGSMEFFQEIMKDTLYAASVHQGCHQLLGSEDD